MKKMMVAAVAAFALGAFAQDSEQKGGSQSWRLTVGGFGRGSMTMRVPDMPSGRFEMYGADADMLYKVCETERFNFWTGVGFGWAPNQTVYNKTLITPIGAGFSAVNKEKNDLQYGELRLMAVPEWKATDSLALGLRLGAALDWTRCKNHWEGGIPTIFMVDGAETYTQFIAQGIVGLQGSYMFTENIGLYAAIDWRGGGEHTLKKNHDKYAKLDMDGWYVSAGVTVGF